jgi:peptidoglycan hydrolase-like protein with peptidoglycan-binding domain
MPGDWHDINDPGHFFKPKTDPEDQGSKKPNTGTDPDSEKPNEPPQPEVSFVSGQFESHPTYCYALNSEAVVSGKIRYLVAKSTFKKLTLDLFAIYESNEEDFGIDAKKYGTAYINNDQTFKFPGVPLYCHKKYECSEDKEFVKPVRYRAVITNGRQDKALEVLLDLPVSDAKKPVDLKEGMYDDKARNGRPGKYPADPAQGYIVGTPIYDLQMTLEGYRYLLKGTANGVFGPKTDGAMKQFQSDSLKKLRVDRTGGKLVEAQSITYKGQSDGIVGAMTRDELEQWKRQNYLRPLPNLYHGDFDREAVNQGVKSSPRGYKNDAQAKREAQQDDYYDIGTPVVNVQRDLQKMDAYTGALDGWFFDKMKDAVNLFQEAAEKGEFLVNGVLTDIGEKLSGHKKGTLDIPTQDMIKKVVEKGGKVKSAGKRAKKGDTGKIVEEINIRLSGFGGGVPKDEFDDETERKVKNFERDYMKRAEPSGIVDEEVAKAIDEFGTKYPLSITEFKCPCTKCGNFGKGQYKGEYVGQTIDEKVHKYEYPGMHRSLLWLIKGLGFHLNERKKPELKIGGIASGYRCWVNNDDKKRKSTNHMGKAADIHIFFKDNQGNWVDGGKPKCDDVRNILKKTAGAQLRWDLNNTFSLEPSEENYKGESLATTWVHVDVRTFNQKKYLQDRFFCKTDQAMDGKQLNDLL